MTVLNRRSFPYSAAALILGAALLTTVLPVPGAAGNAAKLTYLQTNAHLALPRVTLPPGSYRFEVVNPASGSTAVLVTSGSVNGRVHFLGLTRRVIRPRHLPEDQVITVGEAPAGQPIPITAWYPNGSASGYEFIYR